jgi:hypothetical protein
VKSCYEKNVTCKLWIFLLTLMLLCDATDDVDTRAITRRLREDGSLIGVLSTDNSKTDEELLQMSKSWDIVGKDMHIGGDYTNIFKCGTQCC